jgi:hypothetical protein
MPSDPFDQLRAQFDEALADERTLFWEVRAAMRDLKQHAPAQVVARFKLASGDWARVRGKVDALLRLLNEDLPDPSAADDPKAR